MIDIAKELRLIGLNCGAVRLCDRRWRRQRNSHRRAVGVVWQDKKHSPIQRERRRTRIVGARLKYNCGGGIGWVSLQCRPQEPDDFGLLGGCCDDFEVTGRVLQDDVSGKRSFLTADGPHDDVVRVAEKRRT